MPNRHSRQLISTPIRLHILSVHRRGIRRQPLEHLRGQRIHPTVGLGVVLLRRRCRRVTQLVGGSLYPQLMGEQRRSSLLEGVRADLHSAKPASSRIRRNVRRTLYGASGVPFRVKNSRCSFLCSSAGISARRRRTTSAAKGGTATTRFDSWVFGCACRLTAVPLRQTIVPQSHSRRVDCHVDIALPQRERFADPSRGAEHDLYDVPYLSVRFRPHPPMPWLWAANRIAAICSAVSAFGVRLGRFICAVSLIGLVAITPWRTANPKIMLRIVFECLAREDDFVRCYLEKPIDPGDGRSRAR